MSDLTRDALVKIAAKDKTWESILALYDVGLVNVWIDHSGNPHIYSEKTDKLKRTEKFLETLGEEFNND